LPALARNEGICLQMMDICALSSSAKNPYFAGNLSAGNDSHAFEELLDIPASLADYRGVW
jgi:hypothetical protein